MLHLSKYQQRSHWGCGTAWEKVPSGKGGAQSPAHVFTPTLLTHSATARNLTKAFMLSLRRRGIIVFILARACLKDFISIAQNMCKRANGQSLDVCTNSIQTIAVFPRTLSSISGKDAGDRVEEEIKFVTTSLSRPVCFWRYHQPFG